MPRRAPTTLFGLGLLALAACKGAAVDPLDASPSPQAKAEPAPLANVPTPSSTPASLGAGADGGSPPEPLLGDRGLSADSPREVAREPGMKESLRDGRDLAGYSMQAALRAGEGPGAPKAAEVNAPAIETARRRTEARLGIDVSQTRARFVLSGGFVLPPGTELRSRADRYGHLLLWPGEDSYRVAEAGALRALLGERRLDVAPLSPARVALGGEGPRRLNMPTRRVEVSTRAGKATLELAAFRDLGEGGTLVCRLLLDLVSAPQSTAACSADELPMRAELRWTTRGSLLFEVVSIARRTDLPAQELAAPPAGAAFTAAPPPPAQAEALLQKAELTAFRTQPVDVPVPSQRDAQSMAPESGLALVNSSDELKVAWLDGCAVAWVAPGGRAVLPSLVRGRYTLQWRTFLGDGWETPETVWVPGSSEVGAPRGGGP